VCEDKERLSEQEGVDVRDAKRKEPFLFTLSAATSSVFQILFPPCTFPRFSQSPPPSNHVVITRLGFSGCARPQQQLAA
jgi:hypothetical protein